ncbi:gamma-butyrobetaine hydroxylase-like domain-containing protein [Ensifer soli]|uniref:gamma-butyrobetaine hydroxylase-like domain-containing protein n=1 Tax=Ciceribacter sp. sgz301302 TaxID=3342379 RepID=UPI0035B6C420
MGDVWPSELKISGDRRTLTVSFENGAVVALPAEMLRVLSPSAEVQGHGPGQAVTVPGKRSVAIRTVQPTGNYAVRIGFDDGHDSGIFTWTYLDELGREGTERFAAYERALAEKGMNRDTPERPR